MGRADAHLRHIIDLQAAALIRGGLDTGLCVRQNGVEPVSYTHLDVYKRQVEDLIHELKADQIPCIRVYNKCDVAFSGERGHEEDAVSISCLLYTSRCV